MHLTRIVPHDILSLPVTAKYSESGRSAAQIYRRPSKIGTAN